jgi:LPS export ABC transporter protein LptC
LLHNGHFRAGRAAGRRFVMRFARRLKLFLGLCVFVLVAASAAFLTVNPGKKPPPAPPVKAVDVEQAEVVIDGFNFSKTEDDSSAWELFAKRAEVSKKTGMARLKDLDAVIRAKDGLVFNLKAENGEFDTATKKMRLTGGDKGVTVRSSNGYRMSLRDVRWDNDAKELSTDGRVTIDGSNIRIEGKGMVARTDRQEVRIVDGVRTVFTPSN